MHHCSHFTRRAACTPFTTSKAQARFSAASIYNKDGFVPSMSTAVSICSAERLLPVRLCKLSFGFRSSNTLCRHHVLASDRLPDSCRQTQFAFLKPHHHDLQNGRLPTRADAPSQGRAVALAAIYLFAWYTKPITIGGSLLDICIKSNRRDAEICLGS